MSRNVHSGQILTSPSRNMADLCSWVESFQECPEERQISEWDSKRLSENACVSYDLIPPLARAHAHAHTCMHTHRHTPAQPPSLSLFPFHPSPTLVRSFGSVHSLPAPLSAPHPGRIQTHHTFLCCQPSHNSLLLPSATFQPNRSSPVRAWDEEAGPLPPWSPPQLLGVAHGRTLPSGYGEKLLWLLFTQCLSTPTTMFSNAVKYW